MTNTAQRFRSGASIAGFKKKAKGVTPPSTPDRHGVFLTDVIVELGFAGKEEVDAVVEAARTSAKPVEKMLLESGTVDENQLALAIAERNSLDHVDLEKFEVDMSAAAMITPSVGSRYGAVPIAFASDGALIVAVEDPFDSLAMCDIEVMTKSVVRPAIATPTAIHDLIERLPEEPPVKAEGASSTGTGWEMPRVQAQPDLQLVHGEEPQAGAPEVSEPDVEEPEVEERLAEEEEEVEERPAEEEEVEGKHFEQLGAVLAQRAVPDPEEETEADAPLDLGPAPVSESPDVAGGDTDLQRAGRRAQRLESELLVARRQISDLKRQIAEGGPGSPELERQNSELLQRVAELEEQSRGLEERNLEFEERNLEFEQQNARLELKVTELEQRLAEVVSAAEETTAMTAKLDALRRVIERSRG